MGIPLFLLCLVKTLLGKLQEEGKKELTSQLSCEETVSVGVECLIFFSSFFSVLNSTAVVVASVLRDTTG